MAEAKAIKNQNGIIVYIDAPLVVRYARVQSRNRDAESSITLEEFKARESSEMSSGITDADFNIEQIGQLADIKLNNDTTPEEFYKKAESALKFT
jgi:dephospho-CoA kinase